MRQDKQQQPRGHSTKEVKGSHPFRFFLLLPHFFVLWPFFFVSLARARLSSVYYSAVRVRLPPSLAASGGGGGRGRVVRAVSCCLTTKTNKKKGKEGTNKKWWRKERDNRLRHEKEGETTISEGFAVSSIWIHLKTNAPLFAHVISFVGVSA
jgi:hypothetical protein